MSTALGIDTSNYTTSAALMTEDAVYHSKRPLEVKPGEKGLRQNDAVFQHIRQIDEVLKPLFDRSLQLDVIGVSDRPRREEGSYMPCFLVGVHIARVLSQALNVPVETFSHQQGHIAAALYSAGRLEVLRQKFLAFHVSGGTTEALLCEPSDQGELKCSCVAKSLDLKAGQAVDRVGVMLGLSFPAGPALEKLAISCEENMSYRPFMRGADCSLSGIENQCRAMLQKKADVAVIAKYCITAICKTLERMAEILLAEFPGLPLLFSGGVCSNVILQTELHERFGAYFAAPEFSADNAAGPALLCLRKRGLL